MSRGTIAIAHGPGFWKRFDRSARRSLLAGASHMAIANFGLTPMDKATLFGVLRWCERALALPVTMWSVP